VSEKSTKIGVGVVGLGIGEAHARTYLSNDRCILRWVYDVDPKRAHEVARMLGSGAIALSFEQILQDASVDVVSIASYDDAHSQQVIDALAARKHVFVEKPLCRTLDELREIKRVWLRHRKQLKLSSNLVLQSAPLYQWLREAIDRGDFGEIYAFDGDYLYGRIEKITHGWRGTVADYSVMLGGGIHLIDLMLWLTAARPSSVSAVGNRICTQGTDFKYADYVAANLQSSDGLIGRITANFGVVHRHQHVVRVFGTKKTFVYDDAGARIHVTREPEAPTLTLSLSGLPRTKGELIGPFISAIEHYADLEKHTQQMFDSISICLACDRALQTKSTEQVQYV